MSKVTYSGRDACEYGQRFFYSGEELLWGVNLLWGGKFKFTLGS
ncbi:MAG TPA: hypothetical protein PLR86_04930 [Planctomycetota bacterium]|nr:hypothetical protein [Planctomycetota bacterium]